MEILKKSIILSPASYDGKTTEKGILTLQKELGKIKGNLKCFNLNKKQGKLLFGITFNDNVLHKFKVKEADVCLFRFILPKDVDLSKNISCVLIAMDNKNYTPIIWGSSSTRNAAKLDVLNKIIEDDIFVKVQQQKKNEQKTAGFENSKATTIKQKEKDNKEEEYITKKVEQLIDEESQKVINELEEEKKQQQLKDWEPYKKVFETDEKINAFSNENKENKQQKQENQENQTVLKKEEEPWFYDEVKNQIDALFDKYEKESALEEIIPNSTFVRVVFEEGMDSYVFGIIYDEESLPAYIVYGLPSTTRKNTPTQLEGYYQWLPLDPENPEEDGYFLMYQDAKTGEHVKIEVI